MVVEGINKWTPSRNSGGFPQVSTRFSLSMEMSRLTRGGTAEPVSRDQIFRREQRGQGNIHFPCSADHEQDWQPHQVCSYNSRALQLRFVTVSMGAGDIP